MTLIKGRYRIIETIGRGGFGETYLTIDEDLPSNRKCVVKQLKPQRGLITDEMKERFEQEARVLETLGNEHDRIPKLFAHFEDGGEFYLVQEYIPGKTLRQLIDERKTANEIYVREFLLQILPVVEFIHSKKIIHRDIKPDNIIIRESDGKPVLIDFGLVKELMDSQVVSSTIAAGTLKFMALEQMRGRPQLASDVFSLGMTAIAMLTPGADDLPHSFSEEPEWRELVACDVTEEFAELLDRATEIKMTKRFKKAGEFLAALKGDTLIRSSPKPGDVMIGAAGIEFVYIPAGEFEMGGTEFPTEFPIHTVTIRSPFWMGKYQVTQGQWESVMGENPSHFKGDRRLPVEKVSWDDCQKFIEKLNAMNDGNLYTLPTEAEWEYACRAGRVGEFPNDQTTMAWCFEDSEDRTHPVGEKQSNPFGLYDMLGNVWEWCQDRWHDTYDGTPPTDGSAWESGESESRVLRGGSLGDIAYNCRSTIRAGNTPLMSYFNVGLRVAMIPENT